MAVRDSWFLTLVFNCSFVSYCSDSPLCIIVTATYSDIEPPSRSASLTSRLQNAHSVFGVRHTFCLNPRQSSRGLCRVQVVITALLSAIASLDQYSTSSSKPQPYTTGL